MVNAVGSDKFFLPDTAAKKKVASFLHGLFQGSASRCAFRQGFTTLLTTKSNPSFITPTGCFLYLV